MLVDTNVLLDVIQDDAAWADWSISQLRSQAKVHQLVISSVGATQTSIILGCQGISGLPAARWFEAQCAQ